MSLRLKSLSFNEDTLMTDSNMFDDTSVFDTTTVFEEPVIEVVTVTDTPIFDRTNL